MPPRLIFSRVCRSLAIRTRPLIAPPQPRILQIASRRGFADENVSKLASGPNQNGLGHVSEEAADISRVMGETQPELVQGTPVQDIIKRDEESKQKSPQVIKDEMDSEDAAESTSYEHLLALGKMENIAAGGLASDPVELTHKFGLPNLPIPSDANLKYRYDPVVTQVTNLLMKDGKKSVAQRNMSIILNHLRTAPPPVTNATRPLVPGSLAPSHLPLNPVQYLTVAIDSVAPLLRIRTQKGAAGGGAALQIPVPLGIRQRRRQSVQWILTAAQKKKSRGSGRGQFAQRVAEELISVVEGKSSAWERRALVHKTGTSARANLNYRSRRR